MNNDSNLTRIHDYIKATLPWTHGHQLNALTTFVAAIFDKQTGCQADLARTQGNQEAACKRLSRLIHNERLSPKWLAESIAHQALGQVPRFGKVRFTIDWTTEDEQHLLVVSLVIGRRAVPIFWRAYDQSVLKGRTHRYERAVIKRAFKLIFQYVKPGRVRLTADRGFADEPLFALLEQLRVRFVIRVKGCVKVRFRQEWNKLNHFRFQGSSRHRTLGRILYCEKSPRRLWVHQSRARNKQGQWETWSLVSNFARDAGRATTEYSRRFSCEEGFRDAKWYLGFKQARVKDIRAWSRLFGLFILALLILVTLGTFCLLRGDQRTKELLRRVASRRRGRCELSLVSAMLELLRQDRSLLACLLSFTKFKLDTTLDKVS
ncbi:MAG TPA: transposase [Burkholderiales bacterium]|nr:transposase [Burkholderiales bacterium]